MPILFGVATSILLLLLYTGQWRLLAVIAFAVALVVGVAPENRSRIATWAAPIIWQIGR